MKKINKIISLNFNKMKMKILIFKIAILNLLIIKVIIKNFILIGREKQ